MIGETFLSISKLPTDRRWTKPWATVFHTDRHVYGEPWEGPWVRLDAPQQAEVDLYEREIIRCGFVVARVRQIPDGVDIVIDDANGPRIAIFMEFTLAADGCSDERIAVEITEENTHRLLPESVRAALRDVVSLE